MGHPTTESSAQFRVGDPVRVGDPAIHRSSAPSTVASGTAGGIVATAPRVHEDPPPAPGVESPRFVPPAAAPSTEPPVWAVSAAQVAAAAPPGEAAKGGSTSGGQSRSRRASLVATTFAVALLSFYLLEFATALVSWLDAEIRTPGQADAMVTWAACAALVVPALLLRGRWRALPLGVATIAGTLAPVLLSRDLLGLLGIPDVWVGQAFTLHVVFPLCLGVPATVAALLSPIRGGNQ